MAVVDNAGGITQDATGQHNNGKLLDGLPAATATGQAMRWDEAAPATVAKTGGYTQIAKGTLTLGTAATLSLTDASFTGKVAGGRGDLQGASGVLGIVAGSFASSAAETSTGANQAGLGSAAAATQPYNVTDFPGQYQYAQCVLLTANRQPITLVQMVAGTITDATAEVYGYLSFRSDLGANLKWRLWFYYRRASDGFEVPVTPTISLTNCWLEVPEIFLASTLAPGFGLSQTTAGPAVSSVQAATVAPVSPMFPAAIGVSTKLMKEDANQGLWVMNRNKRVFSDFDLGVGTAANAVIAGTSLVFSSTITPMTFGTSTATEYGVSLGSTGASATGLCYVSHGGANLPYALTTANPFYASMKVALTVLSTTGVQQYKGIFGVTTGVTTVAGTSGIAFSYDASADTHWQIVMGAGTMTPVATTITVAANQFYHLEIVKLAGTNQVDFYIDGANVGTISTNFPSAALGVNCGITKSVGTTAAQVSYDWLDFVESVPAKRNSSFLA